MAFEHSRMSMVTLTRLAARRGGFRAGGEEEEAPGTENDSHTHNGVSDEDQQNSQNEQVEELDVSCSCAHLRDKISVIWELKPVEPPKPRSFSLVQDEEVSLPHVPIRLVCVVDISHSMDEPYGPDSEVSKLDKIKVFAQLLVRTISEDAFLSIVTFGTYANVAFPLTKMTSEAKEEATTAIEAIELGGVTNLGAGLLTAVDQFKTLFSKSRFFNDCVLLFTDGMANEGIVETDEMIREVRKRVQAMQEESHFDPDYTIKMVTLGTGGFLPELLFDIGQAFSSDSFFFLDETVNLELNLMKPIILRQTALVSCLNIKITALNGVLLDRAAMSKEYEPVDPDKEETVDDDTCVEYFIYDLPVDTQKHLPCYIRLPNKHKKLLKEKDVLRMDIEYRDSRTNNRTLEKVVTYTDIPKKEKLTLEKDILFAAQIEIRTMAQKILNHCADYIKRLDRAGAKETAVAGGHEIRSYCDSIAQLLTEEAQEMLLHFVEPILVNLEYVDSFVVDLCVRWDDVWARLKAMSSSLGRETPTASGVYAEGAELFTSTRIDKEMDGLAARLMDLYIARGMCTESIDSYRNVIQELQRKLREQAQAQAEESEDPMPSALKYMTEEDIKEMQNMNKLKETRI